MAKNASKIYKHARKIYDTFVEQPGEFSVEEVKLVMRRELDCYRDESFAFLVEDAYTKAERSQKSKGESSQKTLFDLGGVLILEENRRVGKRHAMISHFQEHLRFSDANRAAIEAANDREHLILTSLSPYWPEGATMQQAVEAYRKANPDDESFAA